MLNNLRSFIGKGWLFSALFAVLLGLFAMLPATVHAQETHSTITDSGGSLLNQQNQALIRKMLDEARATRALIAAVLPHGFDGNSCSGGKKLMWGVANKTNPTWTCENEYNGTVKAFAKTDLPNCSINEYLYPSSPTTLGCRTVVGKGAIGAPPAWQWSADTYSLRVQGPTGTWGSWVYLRGDSGCYYKWLIGAYSGCNSSCGPGQQTRTVTCQRHCPAVSNVADSFCSAPKPATSQACDPGYTYNYTAWPSWGACSNNCGSGTQTRARTCQRCDGSTAACTNCGNQCNGSQACTDYSGCGYSWQTGAWSSCSTTCGPGTQTRTVVCRRSDGTNVGDAYCSGAKPATSQGCGGSYTYSYGAWGGYGSCSGACGSTGSQTRNRSCTRCDGTAAACSNCGGACSESRSCSVPATYSYTSWGSWGSCSNNCGSGTQTRSRTCQSCTGATVGCASCGNQCSGSQACTSYTGCSYSWQTGSWSSCNSSCGPGQQTRSVTCRRSDGTTVADSNCGGGKPATSQACGSWTYSYGSWGGYGSCSKTCGGGQQTRTRSCVRCDGSAANCSNCGGACSQNQACNTHSCGVGGIDYCDGMLFPTHNEQGHYCPCCGTCCKMGTCSCM